MDIESSYQNFKMADWELIFEKEIKTMAVTIDPAHDSLHLKRVVKTAKQLAMQENANLNIVIPAAWLHDFVLVPKNSPLRKQASQISATRANEFLQRMVYPAEFLPAIAHCIESHSFSANIKAESLEAQVVQDADRLDALGAIGLARCFMTAGQLQTPFYSADDPLCIERSPDDSSFTIDHFFVKLFKIADTLQTRSAQLEGQRRVLVMKEFLQNLALEI